MTELAVGGQAVADGRQLLVRTQKGDAVKKKMQRKKKKSKKIKKKGKNKRKSRKILEKLEKILKIKLGFEGMLEAWI